MPILVADVSVIVASGMVFAGRRNSEAQSLQCKTLCSKGTLCATSGAKLAGKRVPTRVAFSQQTGLSSGGKQEECSLPCSQPSPARPFRLQPARND